MDWFRPQMPSGPPGGNPWALRRVLMRPGSQADQNREHQRAALFPPRRMGRSLSLSVLIGHRRLIRGRQVCHA